MSNKYEYIVGNIYGCRKLLKTFYDIDKKRLMAISECIYCNNQREHRASELNNSKTNSCQCRIVKHGMNRTKIYSIYSNMKDRCFNSNHHEFYNYGGKGVSICNEWLGENGFETFMEWAYSHGYIEGLSIDRINENGNYEPENCQWLTRSENTIKANKTCQHRKANKGTYYGISPCDKYYEFDNANQFAKENDLVAGCIRQVANNQKKSHKGWKFGFVNELKETS